ncbi:MAG: NUDIX hydrolase [Phycisphaerales bacterium]
MGARPHRIEVIARGLAINGGRVLLCRSVKGGYTYLPGGHVEPGEAAGAALEREMLEETGLECRAGDLVCVHEERFSQQGAPRHELNLVFHMEHPPADTVTSLEPAIAFEWVAIDALGEANLLPESMRVWVRAFAGVGRVDWIPSA